MSLETLSNTQTRLTEAGFVADLTARGGQLHATPSGQTYDPADLVAAEIVRFEGDSDPADEAILVAVASREGKPIGTFTAPYGPEMSTDEGEVLRHLRRARASANGPAATGP